ncbi:MAG: hypothetical protein MZU97_18790 [Bacillus subtilis]|nr:hypothetical protein [Bacillus subtilis]
MSRRRGPSTGSPSRSSATYTHSGVAKSNVCLLLEVRHAGPAIIGPLTLVPDIREQNVKVYYDMDEGLGGADARHDAGGSRWSASPEGSSPPSRRLLPLLGANDGETSSRQGRRDRHASRSR